MTGTITAVVIGACLGRAMSYVLSWADTLAVRALSRLLCALRQHRQGAGMTR